MGDGIRYLLVVRICSRVIVGTDRVLLCRVDFRSRCTSMNHQYKKVDNQLTNAMHVKIDTRMTLLSIN